MLYGFRFSMNFGPHFSTNNKYSVTVINTNSTDIKGRCCKRGSENEHIQIAV